LAHDKQRVLGATPDSPGAWASWREWLEFHDTSLVNYAIAALAPTHLEENQLVYVLVQHVHGAPAQRQHRVVAVRLAPRAWPDYPNPFLSAWAERKALARSRNGGAGVIVIDAIYGADTAVRVTRCFTFDAAHRATAPVNDPRALLTRNVDEGLRPRLCCANVEKDNGTCCCGGWTHKEMRD
jgi:hypothetical protein